VPPTVGRATALALWAHDRGGSTGVEPGLFVRRQLAHFGVHGQWHEPIKPPHTMQANVS
jgi:hypothetical protein